MKPSSIRILVVACTLSIAVLTVPTSARSQTTTYRPAPPVYNRTYPQYSNSPRGAVTPRYYNYAPRTYSTTSNRRPGLFGRQRWRMQSNEEYYWPTGRDVPMAKPWLTP